MILATTKVEDYERFLAIFSTKGAEKRRQHGSKGVTVFRDPSEDDRVWALFNRCAQLAADAATRLGFADGAILTLRRAALVHEFGTTAIPNSIWDKPGPLTRAEFDRVELHPMLTEQMLRRSPALAVLNPAAEPRCCAWRRGV